MTQDTFAPNIQAETNTTPLVHDLIAMHKYCRPAGSKTERKFIARFLKPLGMTQDKAGNLFKQIGANPHVLWSSHTDTVHTHGGTQMLATRGTMLKLSSREKISNCLGADDTAGVWLMSEMIRAGKEGLYIFHRAEESGGIGSAYIADETPEVLDGIEFAIALDRAGKHDVITHQGWSRCCSAAFAKSLAEGLAMQYRPDDGGVFTDTANYTDLIAECTNLSVGYEGAHSSAEKLDIAHVLELREALLALDCDALVCARVPGEADPDRKPLDMRPWGGLWDDDYEYGRSPRHSRTPTIESMVRDYPNECADLLREFGIDEKQLMEELYQRGAALTY
jgi:acetylornithine deacetylase/succinyl-diaminopimelate desuccinylase-like protein